MKKLLLIVLLPALMLACKKDDPAPADLDSIVGRWRLVSYTSSPDPDGETDVLKQMQKSGFNTSCYTESVRVFEADGVLRGEVPERCRNDKSLPGWEETDGRARWKIQGDKLIVTNVIDPFEVKLEIKGNTMTWTSIDNAPINGKEYIEVMVHKRL